MTDTDRDDRMPVWFRHHDQERFRADVVKFADGDYRARAHDGDRELASQLPIAETRATTLESAQAIADRFLDSFHVCSDDRCGRWYQSYKP